MIWVYSSITSLRAPSTLAARDRQCGLSALGSLAQPHLSSYRTVYKTSVSSWEDVFLRKCL